MMLRFVKRPTGKILQQCWIDTMSGDSEWRDVQVMDE